MDTRMSARELYERGRMLRQAKMYDRALADFRSAIQDPNYVGKAHTQAALCFRAMSRHGEAATALEKALASSTLSPNEQVHVLYLLGQTLESLGRHAEALEAYGWVRQADGGFLVSIGRFARYLPLSPTPESVAAQLEAATGNFINREGEVAPKDTSRGSHTATRYCPRGFRSSRRDSA
jgi:tetratricopeptide (TPR) repeat protein